MKTWLNRCLVALALLATATGLGMVPALSGTRTAMAQPAASGNDLKVQAFHALRQGEFDKTSLLLQSAAAVLQDPSVTQMAAWAGEYETQRETFVTERRKQFDKAVAEVTLLRKNHKDQYLIDATARAYLLADDKKAFRNETWVNEVVQQTITMVDQYEASEQWLKAARLYSDLSSVEPANPQWKDKLKTSMRRIRLLSLYAPDALLTIQQAEAKEREEVDRLLHPSTQPVVAATKPATTEAANDSFRTDWKESLRGVRMEMLSEALSDARGNYYRDVPMRDMLMGGLKGVRAILATKGLEKTFPGLSNAAKDQEFATRLDDLADRVKASTIANETEIRQSVVARLRAANADTVDLPEQVLVNEFADGALAELDPFSNMIWPSEQDEFTKNTQGEFGGVGIQIQSEPDGNLRIVSPLEDTPAYRAGIKAGDIVTAIEGKNAKGISINQAVKTITGPPGTTVTLTIRSQDGTVRDYTIRRELIKVASVKGWSRKPGGGWDYMVDPVQKIAYIRMTNFTKATGEELVKATNEFTKQGAQAMILDLRYNPGGLLQAAIEVASRFLDPNKLADQGVIVSTHADRETPNGPTMAKARPIEDKITMPLVVLVNQYSASASEIVSGALKDQNRAIVVGERSFGKGSVQMIFPVFDQKACLKLTTSHYYLPSGRCLHRDENSTEWGVDPDVKVEMTPEQMRLAIDARQDLDILRDAATTEPAPTTQDPEIIKARKDPLGTDSQLSAALLVLRLQLAGAHL